LNFLKLIFVFYSQELPGDNPELRGDLIEGDIIPNPNSKNGIRGDQYRWPNRTVPYELDPTFSMIIL